MRPNVSIKNLGVGVKNRGCQFSAHENPPTPPPPHPPTSPHKNNFKRRSTKPLDDISITLKNKRIEKNLTQKELAEKSNVSEKTIKNWEQSIKNPALARMDTVMQVCEVLEIDPVLIFYSKEDEPNE